MKKKLALFLFMILGYQLAKAQLNEEINNRIERALLSYFNTYGRENYGLPSFREKAYTFGFIISINKTGKVDAVIFSNQTKKLDSLVSFTAIEKGIKQISGLETHKNTNMIGLVLIRRKQDNAITNFYDAYMRRQYNEKQDFDEYFMTMIPSIPKKLNFRKTQLLPTFTLVQMPSIR
ncbi:MAG: hypothetical protein ACO1N4_09125 [Pedobacter sp.]